MQPRLYPEDIQAVRLEIVRLTDLSNSLYARGKPPMPGPTVRFDTKGTKAGVASPSHHFVSFNPVLYLENKKHFLDNVVPHEMAHLVSHHFFGRKIKPHGAEWKRVMVDFGVSPSRTHSYDVSNSSSRLKHEAMCGCPGKTMMLSTVRVNRMKRGHSYICRSCDQPIRLVSGNLGIASAGSSKVDRSLVPPSVASRSGASVASPHRCSVCGKELSPAVARFCTDHSRRFKGRYYCFEHQKLVAVT